MRDIIVADDANPVPLHSKLDRSKQIYESARKDNQRISATMKNTIAIISAPVSSRKAGIHPTGVHRRAYTLIKKE